MFLGYILEKEGIVQTFSASYTPQSNGFPERYNRTLLSKTRSMLFDSGLDSRFWGEALLHASYILNVVSSSADDVQTPYERLFLKKPDVSKIRILDVWLMYIIQKK